jgi:teichuronic acid biosynthesis glycosyltransferase TuaH
MTSSLSGRDILIISQQPWDTEIGSNCKNIALEFSKTNRILYVNSPLDRITIFKNRHTPNVQNRLSKLRTKSNTLMEVQSNLWNLYPDCILESINWIDNSILYNAFNKINNRRFAKSIKKALSTLGFKDMILFNDNEMFKGYYLQELLSPSISIYYSRDYMLAVDYWKKHGETLEPKLIAKSDLCVANSTYLADYCRKYNKNSFYVGQGCDLEVPIDIDVNHPDELRSIKKPIIGYVGALQSIRLDIDVILHLAYERPEWSIVLVGPEDESFQKSRLHNLPNVHFLGTKPVCDLPYFINSFDVCINPQAVNMVTIGNYPRKIDEYLYFGKKVVATKTKAMDMFENFVYLAEDKYSYLELIDRALDENSVQSKEDRMRFARSHSWKESVLKISDAVENLHISEQK